jgi:Glycyl-tRNA synthetase, beta subunit
MRDFLFEVYTEEMPARLINDLAFQLRELSTKKLSEYKLQHGEILTYGTPRRLVLYIMDVNEKEEDSINEIKGPP